MYIYELEVGTVVSVEVKKNDSDSPYIWQCPILDLSTKGKCILVPPIKMDGKVVDFSSPDLIVQTFIIMDEKPIIFRGCNIQYLKMKEDRFHAIICKNEGVSRNRRSHFRVPLNEYCYVNHGKATIDAMIRDISSSGFCFSVGKYDGAQMDFVKVQYHDTLIDKDVHLIGRVVRRVDQEEGRAIFGCYMIPRPEIDKYIAERQRKTLKTADD